MKSYAETEEEQPFDWKSALANPPDKNSYDHDELVNLAENWVTCACGNQCATIPRIEGSGAPVDLTLRDLGRKFSDNITEAEWEAGRVTLAAIEKRSAEVLAHLQIK